MIVPTVVPVHVEGVDVGAVVGQQPHDVVVAAVGGEVQRRLFVVPNLERIDCRGVILSWPPESGPENWP